jgi:hypothetical protein
MLNTSKFGAMQATHATHPHNMEDIMPGTPCPLMKDLEPPNAMPLPYEG